MLFTWVPPLGHHIIRQSVKSWICLLVAIAIVIALPFILQPLLSGIVTDEELDLWIPAHFGFIITCFTALFVLYEILVYLHYRKVWIGGEEGEAPIIKRLASRALLRHTPRTLFYPRAKTNVAAMPSLFSGHFISFYGESFKILNERETEVVIAHEVAHLKHMDRVSALVLVTTGIIFSVYFSALIVACVASIILQADPAQGEILLKASWVVLALQIVHSYIKCAHSRTREYLADAGSIALAGLDFKVDLISALKKLEEHHWGRGPNRLAFLWPEFLRTHPRISNRAKALGLDASKIVI